MQKDTKQFQIRLSDKQGLPNLKRTYSVAKNFIALSKVDLDKNVATIQPPNQNIKTREVISSYSHKRIISGMNINQFVHSQSQMSKTYRNFGQQMLQKNKTDTLHRQISASIGNVSTQPKQKNQKALPIIQKSKISTKPIGLIKGYSVNSHPGSINTANEDRICVITNLNKSIIKDQQISFFSIFDGNNGVSKAQYFRDNFHVALMKEKNLHKDVENSIKKAFLSVEQNFIKSNTQLENLPTTKFLMVLVIDNQVYVASMGENKMAISKHMGKQLTNPLFVKQTKRKSFSKPKLSRNQPFKVTINIFKIDLKQLDFIILGSEGLFQNFSQVLIAKKFWKQILQRTQRGFHTALGQSTNSIMNEVFQQFSTKNVSLIVIAFQNAQICFGENNRLDLPFLTQNFTLNIEEI